MRVSSRRACRLTLKIRIRFRIMQRSCFAPGPCRSILVRPAKSKPKRADVTRSPQIVPKACRIKEISLTYFVDDHEPRQRKTSTSWYATYMQVSKYATPTSENKVASPAPRPPKVQCWMKKYTKARFKHRPFRIDVSMFWIDSTLYFGGRGERHFRFAFRIFRSTLWVCVTKLGQNAVSQMRLTLGNWLSQTVS